MRGSLSLMIFSMKMRVERTVRESGCARSRLQRSVRLKEEGLMSRTYSKTTWSSGRARYVCHSEDMRASFPVTRLDSVCVSMRAVATAIRRECSLTGEHCSIHTVSILRHRPRRVVVQKSSYLWLILTGHASSAGTALSFNDRHLLCPVLILRHGCH